MKPKKRLNRKVLEHHYEQLFKYANDIITLHDKDLKIVDVNERALKVFGYTREEMLGMDMSLLFAPSMRKQIPELKKTIDETGSAFYETTRIRKDGSEFPVEISSRIIEIEGVKYCQSIGRDITDRIKYEEELILAKEKAEESDRLKTAFLHNISHEIRTPMNAIVGFSALLNEPDIDSSTRHFYNEMIMHSSDQLLSIITDIIDISNIETNIVKITRSEFLLNSIFRSLHEQFLLRAKEKNITIISEPGLPDEDSIILTDKTKLVQIVSNLLNNALKFTQQGQIKFGYAVKDKLLEFFVSDTGLGIAEEYHKRIFERFYQVENPVTKLFEGTGLGLAISSAYVELLGGEIRLSSTPGGGSTFYFTLPYEKPEDKIIPDSTRRGKVSLVFPEKKKILVAEDVESNFSLIQNFLCRTNVEVKRAFNGKEAVEICLSDRSIDLVLMDIRMPVMNGYTATELIRQSRPEIPIIAQTAFTADRERAIECGCSGIILKPFDKKSLLDVISEFI
jgi:PAS domain S-box-containing protein